MIKKDTENITFLRVIPDTKSGLTQEQVNERIIYGATNKVKVKTSKSYLQIIIGNTFNFFSCLLFGIAIFFVICNTGIFSPYIPANYFGITKFGFLGILVINILIGTVQEIRSKRVLEKLKIVSKNKFLVTRDMKEREIFSDDIVVDDIIKFSSGCQVPVDCIILEGSADVDESVLTGESENVKRTVGDRLLSGSLIISGSVKCSVDKVGDDTYAMKIQDKVKKISKNKSELMKNIYGIIKVMTSVVVVMVSLIVGVLSIRAVNGNVAWAEIVSSAATAAVGLIPTGLVLLTSVTLAVSIISLVKKKVLIQELYSLEGLSKVDTICLDKTGTLTTGNMKVVKVINIKKNINTSDYLGSMLSALTDWNATTLALAKHFSLNTKYAVKTIIPFSSETKSTRVILENGTEIVLGAPEFILSNYYTEEIESVQKYTEKGLRVLAFMVNKKLASFICLEDEIRPAIIETIQYFNENGVDVKIISGDNPVTVSNIAKRCGVNDAEKIINMQNVPIEQIPNIVNEFTVFGRITPEQKEAVIKALQAKGKKVAMTGDGVNDLLALKAANTSISFNSATDAAKGLSDVILLDNSFDHVPDVVREGRRVVSNITRTAVLFLTKTFFLVFLILMTLPTKQGLTFLSVENLMVFEAIVIALSGFLLSIENYKSPITSTFKKTVYPKAIISGLLCAMSAMIVIISYNLGWLGDKSLPTTFQVQQALITILVLLAGIAVLVALCYPFNNYRLFVIILAIGLAAVTILAYPDLFLNADSGGLSLNELISTITRPFDFNHSIYVYFTREAYIIIIAFTISLLPVYACEIVFINWLLKRSFLKRLTEIQEETVQKIKDVFTPPTKK